MTDKKKSKATAFGRVIPKPANTLKPKENNAKPKDTKK